MLNIKHGWSGRFNYRHITNTYVKCLLHSLHVCAIYKYRCTHTLEGSNAEVGQLIAGIKFGSFLTPEMASKNDARHGIGLS